VRPPNVIPCTRAVVFCQILHFDRIACQPEIALMEMHSEKLVIVHRSLNLPSLIAYR
jgi:hypothetical protein